MNPFTKHKGIKDTAKSLLYALHGILLPVILLCSISISAQTTTYYIANEGDDNNNGTTQQTPFKTIAKLNTLTFAPGDRIRFKGGQTFTGSLELKADDAGDADSPLMVNSFGEGQARIDGVDTTGIYIYNTSGITIEQLIVTGSGTTTNTASGIHLKNDLEGDIKLPGIHIANTEVYGFGLVGIYMDGTVGNSGFSQVVIEDVKVHDCLEAGIAALGEFDQNKSGYAHADVSVKRAEVFNISGIDKKIHSGNGIMLSDIENGSISHATVYNCGWGNTACGGPVGIWFYESDNVVIEYNEVFNISSGTGCDGGGFDLDGGVTNGIMQYNYSHDNDGPGFLVGQFIDSRPMDAITVRYNISERDGATNGSGIYLFNVNPDHPPKNIDIYHNTVFTQAQPNNAKVAAFGVLEGGALGTGITVSNNLFYASQGGAMVRIPPGYTLEIVNNHYYSEDDPVWEVDGQMFNDLAQFRQAGFETLNGTPTGNYGDPMLNAPGDGGTIGYGKPLIALTAYQLEETSPALNTGIQITKNSSTRDFFGNPPLSGPAPDAGAFEFNDTIPPVITLLGADPMEVEAGSPFTDPGAVTDDGSQVVVSDEEYSNRVGTYEIIYSATDLYGNTATTKRVVNVSDNTPPEILCDTLKVNLNKDGEYILKGSTLTGLVDDFSNFTVEADRTLFNCADMEEQVIFITATDAYQNKSTCQIPLIITDNTPPELGILDPSATLTFYAPEKNRLPLPDLSALVLAKDNCTVTDEITITQHPLPETMLAPGNHNITMKATDASGNSKSITVFIKIERGFPEDRELMIYPNPFRDIVRTSKDAVLINVYDLTGKKVHSEFASVLDLSYLSPGTYLFEVIIGPNSVFKKAIKY